jgi:hypothetical protein
MLAISRRARLGLGLGHGRCCRSHVGILCRIIGGRVLRIAIGFLRTSFAVKERQLMDGETRLPRAGEVKRFRGRRKANGRNFWCVFGVGFIFCSVPIVVPVNRDSRGELPYQGSSWRRSDSPRTPTPASKKSLHLSTLFDEFLT